MAKTTKPRGKPRGLADPKNRHVAKGNKYAAGPHRLREPFITQQLIACLNEVYLEEGEDGKLRKTNQKRLAKMCIELSQMACKGNLDAIAFIWERVEGKVTQHVTGKIDHVKRLEMSVSQLTDEELETMERVTRKLLEAEGVKIIEHQPQTLSSR
jgi:hypothetical protein